MMRRGRNVLVESGPLSEIRRGRSEDIIACVHVHAFGGLCTCVHVRACLCACMCRQQAALGARRAVRACCLPGIMLEYAKVYSLILRKKEAAGSQSPAGAAAGGGLASLNLLQGRVCTSL